MVAAAERKSRTLSILICLKIDWPGVSDDLLAVVGRVRTASF